MTVKTGLSTKVPVSQWELSVSVSALSQLDVGSTLRTLFSYLAAIHLKDVFGDLLCSSHWEATVVRLKINTGLILLSNMVSVFKAEFCEPL